MVLPWSTWAMIAMLRRDIRGAAFGRLEAAACTRAGAFAPVRGRRSDKAFEIIHRLVKKRCIVALQHEVFWTISPVLIGFLSRLPKKLLLHRKKILAPLCIAP